MTVVIRELRGHDGLLREVTELSLFKEVADIMERFSVFGHWDGLRRLVGALLVAGDVLLSALPRVYGASYVQSARCSVQ